ncbi:MBL fold metallo-hydrolase [Ignisphaera sp. 4213-co]|uniref:MBL fold metallo-hydrolase n=1 Tax=Ignisphaera cupida TaxID=3050454 RepID=A0ABD4Z5S1_9CREN|nr:MBL fold metallo-hydrolase [Ignisphaera sp. 4213-co]MDK6028362.1 MBL fold metallo-hydrolase [Ignisphaera sp. 4213-co]
MKLEILVLGSGREVGRAAIAIKRNSDQQYLLFDYGINFDLEDKPVLPLPISPNKIRALFISHAHLDHIGAAPLFYISSHPSIYSTLLTALLSKIMISDMLRLSGYYLPFEYLELDTMINSIKTLSYGAQIEIDDKIVNVFSAGHIPGSAMYRVEFRDGTSVIYTGDVNTIDTRIVKGATLNGLEADVLVMESTYGLYNHPIRERVEESFIETVKSVVEDGGIALVPAFSLGRAQEILALLADRMPHANVYYDGMSREILELFLQFKEYINNYQLLEKAAKLFTPVKGSDMRKQICKEGGSVIVSPAGMLKGGPAQYYVKRLYNDSKNAIILVSYQAPSTPGRRLLTDGVLDDSGTRVKAKVYWFDFSSHAGSNNLVELAKSVRNLKKVILIHGSEDAAFTLGYRIKEAAGADFEVPKTGDSIIIEV